MTLFTLRKLCEELHGNIVAGGLHFSLTRHNISKRFVRLHLDNVHLAFEDKTILFAYTSWGHCLDDAY